MDVKSLVGYKDPKNFLDRRSDKRNKVTVKWLL